MLATAQENKRRSHDRALEQRIDYAKFLLTQTAVSLREIAADCGWKTEKNFAAVFQQCVGVTPVHYRNWHRG